MYFSEHLINISISTNIVHVSMFHRLKHLYECFFDFKISNISIDANKIIWTLILMAK